MLTCVCVCVCGCINVTTTTVNCRTKYSILFSGQKENKLTALKQKVNNLNKTIILKEQISLH